MSYRCTKTLVSAMLMGLIAFPVHAALDEASKGSEVSMLQDAYVLLSQANHDYNGHRVGQGGVVSEPRLVRETPAGQLVILSAAKRHDVRDG